MIFGGVFVSVVGTGFRRSGRYRAGGRAGVAYVGARRGESLRRWSFWVQALQGAEGVCGRDQGGVVVPALPGTAFVVVEPEAGLDLAVVVLDPPTRFRPLHQPLP